MSSLYQLYKHKDKNGTGTVVNKTYTVPLSELYVEPGLNIREIDRDHVAEFRDAFIAGESVPLDVGLPKGVKLSTATTAITAPLKRLKQVLTSSALSAKTSSGTKLIVSPSWLPGTWQASHCSGTRSCISAFEKPGGSRTRSKKVAFSVRRRLSPAFADLRRRADQHGACRRGITDNCGCFIPRARPRAASVAVRQMDKARASGKSKLTRSAALPQFSAAKARQFLQIVADQADIELPADARHHDNYREFLKEAGWESEA